MCGLLLVAGCSDAVYTLGPLEPDATVDANTSGAGGGGTDASGGTGGNAGMGGMAGSGGAGGTAGACVPERSSAQRMPLDLHVMVNTSISATVQTIFPQIGQSITAFAEDPTNGGTGMGLDFYGAACNFDDYAMPQVPIATLPAAAADIRAALQVAIPIDGLAAAVSAAVGGATQYAAIHAAQSTARQSAVILFTDGVFNPTCDSGSSGAVAYASAALAATPSVETYVIAIDRGLFDPAIDLTPFDQLAAAGGSGSAVKVPIDVISSNGLIAAFRQTALRARPCAFKLPAGYDGQRAAIEFRSSTAPNTGIETWLPVADLAACNGTRAVYLKADGYVWLCPAACSASREYPAAEVSVLQTCP